jgi:hypothetical protein
MLDMFDILNFYVSKEIYEDPSNALGIHLSNLNLAVHSLCDVLDV